MEVHHNFPNWLSARLQTNIFIDGLCGEGGMGIVARAFHQAWRIPLAIKSPRGLADERVQEAFFREAELWAELGTHPYIVTLFYAKQIESRPLTFSEFVDGGGLDVAIRKRSLRGVDEEITLSRLLAVAASAAWGLAAAHEAGLAHCDFKPSNVFLESLHIAKVGDFGLAFRSSGKDQQHRGYTPLYASPEQIRGDSVSRETDFWSWAATCFETFLGGATWSSGAVVRHAFAEYVESGAKAPGYPRMPQRVIDILNSCLQTLPTSRPDSFAEIAEAFCDLHEELLDQPCPAIRPVADLLAADSLNNRGVSLIDLGDLCRARNLFYQAIDRDAFHPEANFNLQAFLQRDQPERLKNAKRVLEDCQKVDPSNSVIPALIFRICNLLGNAADARRNMEAAIALGHDFTHEPAGIVPVLARPVTGDQLAFESERFHRLMGKAQEAIDRGDKESAARYILMAGDLSCFHRHPELKRLRALVGKQ